MKKFVPLTAILSFIALSGCNLVVLNPSGDIAVQQANLIVYSVVTMLIVIVPVIALTVFFAIRYRASNTDAPYDPDWHHSTSLEIVIWSFPLAIIICLAGLTWVSTHRLEPKNDLSRIDADTSIEGAADPLLIQVVSMDWKWLFIYPEQGIASVNEFAAPVDRPIEFHLTSATVMNSFYIPALAGQIYTMAGMQTELNAVINEPGIYKGFSANYSGEGFSQMRFKFHGVDDAGFDAWVSKVKGSAQELDKQALQVLNQPSIAHPVAYYNGVDETLWERVVNICVNDDDLCMHDMMMVDALGGGGLDGLWNREMFRGLCSVDDPGALMALIRPEMRIKETDLVAAMTLAPPAVQVEVTN